MLATRRESSFVKRYPPLVENTGLFRQFAGVQLTEDGILAFANQYGSLLGLAAGLRHAETVRSPPGTESLLIDGGENYPFS